MMRLGSRLPTAAAIVVGGLLGWLMANNQFDPGARADSDRRTATEPTPACYAKDSGRSTLLALAPTGTSAPSELSTQQTDTGKKPNILVIFGDDIGQTNVSAYTMGLMGYRTPNIDRIAKEGHDLHRLLRRAKLHGRPVVVHHRPVHLPHRAVARSASRPRPSACRRRDPTLAELLKNHGYATGQFGKNHLGDKNEFLPTVHGFDEFFGNLYHLNAEEEPEQRTIPRDPEFSEKFGPRGVLKCKATDKDDPTVDPRFGRVGKQTIEDTGPLTKKRMETIDDETSDAAIDYIKRQAGGGQAVLLLVQQHANALPHARRGRAPQPAGPDRPDRVRRRHGRARRPRRQAAEGTRRLGNRRRHDRPLHHRQRPAHEYLARRGDDPVP